MPRYLLAKTGLHYRCILYGSTSALSLAILGAAFLFLKGGVEQYGEHQLSSFSQNKEGIQKSVDQFSARLLQFAELYEGGGDLRSNDSVRVQKYANELVHNGGVIVTGPDVTVTPFTLISRLVGPQDHALLAMNLRALRDVSILPSIDANKLGLALHSYLYSPDASFFASSPPLSDATVVSIRGANSQLFVRKRIAMAESVLAGVPDTFALAQRPLWRPADGRDDRGLVSRVILPLYNNKKRILTLSLVLPDQEVSQSFIRSSTLGPGFFLFSRDGRRNLGGESLSDAQREILNRLYLDREIIALAHNRLTTRYSDGMFIVTQRIAGPDWIAVYAYQWIDVLNNLRGDFLLGAAACMGVLIFMWVVTVYVDRRMTQPLLASAENLIESQNFGKAIVDTLPIGIGVYAPGSTEVVLENSIAKQMLKLREGDSGASFYHHVAHTRNADSSEDCPLIEMGWDVGDGIVSYFGIASSEARLEGRTVIIVCMVDMNQHKASENLLIEAKRSADEASRAKSMFLAIASHEIRTPLHGAMGYLELLCMGTLEHQQREWVIMIRRSFESLLGLVNDLLDQAKLEANALQINPVAMSPNDVVEQCARNFAGVITQAGLDCYCFTDPRLDVILQGDAQRLGQILQNLLGNAAKFTERGSITLTSRVLKDEGDVIWARFEVDDTGVGIPTSMQTAIFDPLTQVDETISHRYGGTGLGLFLCRNLSQLMGGHIKVRSELGVGSVFSVEIPFKRDPSRKRQNAEKPLMGLIVNVLCATSAWEHALMNRLRTWGALVRTYDDLDNSPAHLCVLAEMDAPAECVALLGFVKLSSRGPLAPHPDAKFMAVTSFSRDSLLEALLILAGRKVDLLENGNKSKKLDEIVEMAIIVAEDDPVNRVLIHHQLEALGCNDVRVAVDGQEALEFWKERKADLVITDLGMPHLNGFELLRALDRVEHPPFVVATSASIVAEVQAGTESFFDRLIKPVQLNELRRVLIVAERKIKSRSYAVPDHVFVPELEALMRKTFIKGWGDERRQIEDAMSMLDLGVLQKRLHRLQGALMALGYDDLAHESYRLQHLSGLDAWSTLAAHCRELLNSVERKIKELNKV